MADSRINKEYYKYNDYTLEQGTIDGQGNNDDSSSTLQTRVRSSYIKTSDSILRITADSYISIIFYDENRNYIGRMAYYVQSAEISHNGYIRIVFSGANDLSILTSTLNENISISYINDELYDKQYINPSLEQGTIDGQGNNDDSSSTLQTRVRTIDFIEGENIEYIKADNDNQEIRLIPVGGIKGIQLFLHKSCMPLIPPTGIITMLT